MKLLVVRAGVYNIGNNIKYVIAVSMANSYSVSHREYENVYMIVREPAKPQPNPFDFFEDIKENAFRKKE